MVLGGMPILQAIPIDVHIDNRDTAKAHILAAENPHAKVTFQPSLLPSFLAFNDQSC